MNGSDEIEKLEKTDIEEYDKLLNNVNELVEMKFLSKKEGEELKTLINHKILQEAWN